MTVVSIIADLLRSIPAWLRKALLAVFALCVVAETILRIFHADLPYDEIDQTLVYVGGYLGVQSAANVGKDPELPKDPDAIPGDYPADPADPTEG